MYADNRTQDCHSKTVLIKKILLNSKQDLHLMNKLVKRYTWGVVFSGSENWTLQEMDQNLL